MSDYIKLTTVREVRAAIKKATNVWLNVRLGTVERTIAITKKAALEMLHGMGGDTTAEDIEAFGGWIADTSPDGYSIWIN